MVEGGPRVAEMGVGMQTHAHAFAVSESPLGFACLLDLSPPSIGITISNPHSDELNGVSELLHPVSHVKFSDVGPSHLEITLLAIIIKTPLLC